MKLVIAYIRHDAFEPIRAELVAKGLPSMSVSDVKGTGRQRGVTERYRGSSVTNFLRPKLRVEMSVADEDAPAVVEAISIHARTGNIGDGKIFVLPVEEVIRIRTGDSGDVALERHDAADGPPSTD